WPKLQLWATLDTAVVMPVKVSLTNTSSLLFVSPVTRFDDREAKAMNRPSAEIEAVSLRELPAFPLESEDMRVVLDPGGGTPGFLRGFGLPGDCSTALLERVAEGLPVLLPEAGAGIPKIRTTNPNKAMTARLDRIVPPLAQ